MEEVKRNNSGRGVIGIVFMLIGFAIIAKAFHFFPRNIAGHIFTWEMILIVLGVVLLVTRENRSTGIILLIIGLVFWLPDVVYLPYTSRKVVWGVVFIGIGLLVLFRTSASMHIFGGRNEARNSDFLDDISVFGGGDKVITSQNFKGGKITAIFGGSKIDLRNSKLAPGKNVLDIFCLFGGSNIIVPAGWTVKVDVIAILGGFSDKRYKVEPNEPIEVGKELIIRGFAMFGGGELKN